MSKFLTAPVPTKSLPGGIPFIIGNEAAERFSFYGMKGILVTFMATYLWLMNSDPNAMPMSEAKAIEWYHGFTFWVYLTPIAGALLADVLLGKYLTIMFLSIVYCLGHGALALMGGVEVAAIENTFGVDCSQFFLILGLSLIAVGSGGIKPCVSAHVGDQFGKSNAFWLTKVFGWFYVSINLGAALSNLLTPWLLEWYGPHWAFGVPGVLMALATFVFWLGRHRFVHVPPGGIAFLKETFSWVGISTILKLLVIYIFVAVFWALFDQTGSSWVLQGANMNRDWLGITWLPAQIQMVNPVMILLLVPFFTMVAYPAVDRFFTLTPIRKIAIGLFLMVPGFGLVAVAQTWIDQGQQPSIGWQVLAYAILTASEVMVSITCLEFSYTQAPRKMKSIIMAIFMCSVALGNLFTAVVNSKIQIPNPTADTAPAAKLVLDTRGDTDPGAVSAADLQKAIDGKFPDSGLKYAESGDGGFSLSMAWPNFEGGDQITVGFDSDGTQTGIEAKGISDVKKAFDVIEAMWANDRDELPKQAAGQAAIGGIIDPWGQPLTYKVISGTQARVTSNGPDELPLTSDDINDVITVNAPVPPADAQTWRQRAIAERQAKFGKSSSEESDVTEGDDGKSISSIVMIGGGETLEGADYFWFFVKLMLGTAICFLPVMFFYRPKEYLQEEGDVDPMESTTGAISDQ